MKSYILTDNERRKLKKWIQTAQEDQTTRNLFTDPVVLHKNICYAAFGAVKR